MNNIINPIFLTDSYKLSHIHLEVPGIHYIYSNFTPRHTTLFEQLLDGDFNGEIVLFGLQAAIKEILIDSWNNGFFNRDKNDVINDAKRILVPYIGDYDFSHFEKLHDLGYLPIKIKALKEGSLSSAGVPYFTITNTVPEFEWLVNYLESILSAQIWKPLTVATLSRQFRLLSNKYALLTNDSIEGTEWQNHDFSFRGQPEWNSSASAGAAWLTSSMGTDNVPSLMYIEKNYNQNVGEKPVAGSVIASEHSISACNIQYFINKARQENLDINF